MFTWVGTTWLKMLNVDKKRRFNLPLGCFSAFLICLFTCSVCPWSLGRLEPPEFRTQRVALEAWRTPRHLSRDQLSKFKWAFFLVCVCVSGVSGKGFFAPGHGEWNWKSHSRLRGGNRNSQIATGREGKFGACNPGNPRKSRESYKKQGIIQNFIYFHASTSHTQNCK